MKCVRIAKSRRPHDKALIIHSDRRVQYTSTEYTEELKEIRLSYSHKGNSWDNACIESFHSLIKREWINKISNKGYTRSKANSI
ncbi:integrase core domain-containing protein [Erysipelothrix tonsillarum]|uniref:integrase core domain-containing protein n=1 Tax=Erysipelothrix tonsillarum TaxID=38402 RepID=UPI0012EAD395